MAERKRPADDSYRAEQDERDHYHRGGGNTRNYSSGESHRRRDRDRDRDRERDRHHVRHSSDGANGDRNSDSHRDKRARPSLPLRAKPEFGVLESNAHILQVAQNPGAGHESRTDFPFTRTIGCEYPTLPYRRRKDEVKTVIHWGQRKLLMSEIEFLTLHARPGDIVLYAGAAPGTHTPQLIDMFPQLSFVLVDPAPFSAKLREGERVRLRQECFTDELAQEYTGLSERLLFVCDVRSCDPNIMENAEVEKHVWEDMLAQMRWHMIMRPRRSMLKFRLPWQQGTSEYLDGDIYLPVWAPITTTEARLITHENSVATRSYDNTVYEQQMFFFNTRGRVARYNHAVPTSPEIGDGLDYCYDCAAEIHILALFLQQGPPSHRGVWAEPAAAAPPAPATPAFASAADSLVKTTVVQSEDAEVQPVTQLADSVVPDGAPPSGSTETALGGEGCATISDLGATAAATPAPQHSSAIDGAMVAGLAQQIARLSRQVSAQLGGGRTLESTNSDPEERLLFIRSKQWIQGAPAYAPQLRPAPAAGMSTVAHRMMANMQFVPGQGLGAHGTGMVEPVAAGLEMRATTRGLGYVPDNVPLPPAARVASLPPATAAADTMPGL